MQLKSLQLWPPISLNMGNYNFKFHKLYNKISHLKASYTTVNSYSLPPPHVCRHQIFHTIKVFVLTREISRVKNHMLQIFHTFFPSFFHKLVIVMYSIWRISKYMHISPHYQHMSPRQSSYIGERTMQIYH